MPVRTKSEKAFQAYLVRRGVDARYEELPPGIARPLDFSFECGGKTLRLEVKEWKPKETRVELGRLGDYGPIREKIKQARKQFKEYKGRGEPCVLGVYDPVSQLIMLDDIAVLGAMRGHPGWVFSMDAGRGIGDMSRSRATFLSGGSMVHHTAQGKTRLQNRTISSIGVLGLVDVRSRRVAIKLASREANSGRSFTFDETLAQCEQLCAEEQGDAVALRLVIYDNPDAEVPVPEGFPCGPFDERIGAIDGLIARTYVGAELAALERGEHAIGIRSGDPLGIRRE